jgi:hypothetical protein
MHPTTADFRPGSPLAAALPCLCPRCRVDIWAMTALTLLVLAPMRFEHMVSTLGLGYMDSLARVTAGNTACLAARLVSLHVRQVLSQDSPNPSACPPVYPRGKLKAA